jgi:hypothetical protein
MVVLQRFALRHRPEQGALVRLAVMPCRHALHIAANSFSRGGDFIRPSSQSPSTYPPSSIKCMALLRHAGTGA